MLKKLLIIAVLAVPLSENLFCEEKQATAPEKQKVHGHKKRGRKKSNRPVVVHKRPTKKFEDLSLEEAREAVLYFDEIKDEYKKVQVLERVVLLVNDQDELAQKTRELAQLHEKLGNLDAAVTVYEQYTKLFPGNKDIDEIAYKVVEILNKQATDFEREQAKIENLIKQSLSFLDRFGKENRFSKQVETALLHGRKLLALAILARAYFYLDRHAYSEQSSTLSAAQKRLVKVFDEIVPHMAFTQTVLDRITKNMTPLKAEDFAKKTDEQKIASLTSAYHELITAFGGEKVDVSSSFFKRLF